MTFDPKSNNILTEQLPNEPCTWHFLECFVFFCMSQFTVVPTKSDSDVLFCL